MIPIAGSAYTYGYATLGELVALDHRLGSDPRVPVRRGDRGGRLVRLLRRLLARTSASRFPTAWTQAPLNVVGTHTLVRNLMCIDAAGAATAAVNGACQAGAVLQPGIINLPAILLVVLMTTLLVIGIKESANFNNVIVFIKMAIVILVIGFGFMYVNTANWHPFIPREHRRVRPLRIERHRPRRGSRVLRLHRIRRGLDRGAGGEESTEGHADRHSRVARRSAPCSTS